MSRTRIAILPLLWVAMLGPVARGEGFLTTTFGNSQKCRHPGTLKVEGTELRFDLSALPAGAKVCRAVLRVDARGHKVGMTVKVVPADLPDARPLELLGPFFDAFDATAPVKAWAAKPESNKGLKIESSGGVNFAQSVLEVSYAGKPDRPALNVTGLKAVHQSGQTFLTWKEIEDVVGSDEPIFEDFEKKVLDARANRTLAYRVYRHDKPITADTLGQAELAREVEEVLPAWNLKAVRNTEHPNQGFPTKNSVLRPGYNLVKADVVPRYRITDPGEPLPRATGLCVFTITQPGKRYYAVVPAIDGVEAVGALEAGCSLAEPVDEKPGDFPAIVYQRSSGAKADAQDKPQSYVDIYNSWIEPPYNNVPTQDETAIIRWADLPKPDPANPLPVYVFTTTYGGTSADLGPGWAGARRHVAGAFTVGLAEGGIWQGFHECVGTLKGYDQGVVHNYPQRRALSAAAWAVSRQDFALDRQRVYFWSQLGSWALRYGDVFAVVMSNGYGNLAIGKQAQNYGSMFGPYPRSTKNFAGVDQWEYMDLPKWIRENPTVELPYWMCWPAYGAYSAHTVGDFGFLPWPETIHALASTKRAFAATWNSNGPGCVGPLRALVPRIRLNQSLPAFGNCSLDSSPGDGDHADAEKSGGINIYQVWEPETITDEPDRWEIALTLRQDCPYPDLTTDVTPRRCQKFKGFKPGDKFKWTVLGEDGSQLQSGQAQADKWGLVTVEGVRIPRSKVRLSIRK